MRHLTMRELREAVEDYTVFYRNVIKRDASLTLNTDHVSLVQRATDKMLEVLNLVEYVLEEALDASLRRLAKDLRALIYAFEKKICNQSLDVSLLTRFLAEQGGA